MALFLVNYAITAAFIGTGMELMRLGSLFLYTIRPRSLQVGARESEHSNGEGQASSLTQPLELPWVVLEWGAC